MRTRSWGSAGLLSLCPHLFSRGHEPHHGGPTVMTSSERNNLPKAPDAVTLDVRVQRVSFGGTQAFSPSCICFNIWSPFLFDCNTNGMNISFPPDVCLARLIGYSRHHHPGPRLPLNGNHAIQRQLCLNSFCSTSCPREPPFLWNAAGVFPISSCSILPNEYTTVTETSPIEGLGCVFSFCLF